MKNLKHIKKELRNVRFNIERYAAETGWTSSVHLAGLCGISSYVLFHWFKERGYSPTFHINDCHAFLTVDGYWVDLTLKQFDCDAPKIYLQKRPWVGDRDVHAKGDSAKTVKKMKRLFRGWDKSQNPFRQTRLPKL